MDEIEDMLFKKKKFVHVCTLPPTTEVLTELVPKTRLNFFLRYFRGKCLLSTNVSHRKLYTKSSRALERERRMHLEQFYYIIHPFSAFTYYWELYMIIIYFLQLTSIPYCIIQKMTETDSFGIYYTFVTRMLTIGNIGIQCFTGYYREDIKIVILEQKSIIRRYLKTYFILDILGTVPIGIILYAFNFSYGYIQAAACLIFFNLFSLIKYTENFREKSELDFCPARIFQTFLLFFGIIQWIVSLNFVAGNIDYPNVVNNAPLLWWLESFYFMVFTAERHNNFTFYGFTLLVQVLGMLFGLIMRNIIIAQVIVMCKTHFGTRRKYQRLFLELNEFCNYKRLPLKLKERIFNYYEFKLQSVYYNEPEIEKKISENLRQDIGVYLCKVWFEADIFKVCSLQLKQVITFYLVKDIFLTNDVIYKYGSKAEQIYLLKCGTVAMYDSHGREVKHIEEGNFFSEQCLILSKEIPNEYDAIAIENCEVYTLSRNDFFDVIHNFPEDYELILDILYKRTMYLRNSRNNRLRSVQLDDYYNFD